MVNVFLDFNAVIVNLNNIDKELGLSLAENIKMCIRDSAYCMQYEITKDEAIKQIINNSYNEKNKKDSE